MNAAMWQWMLTALRWGLAWAGIWLAASFAAAMIRSAALNLYGARDEFIEDLAQAVRLLLTFVFYPILQVVLIGSNVLSRATGKTVAITREEVQERTAAALKERGFEKREEPATKADA